MIITIGVTPTCGLLGQGKANDSQDKRQYPGRISKCKT